MGSFRVSDDQVRSFAEDGYLMVPGMFDEVETRLLYGIGKSDTEKRDRVGVARDTEGRESKLWLSSDSRDDIYNAFVRSHRLAGTMEKLLGDEVYLYHYKMMVKEARVGGAWEWHQDYGYWYNNGCVYPDMGSVMIAVDGSKRANGCLEVLKGSHLCGRIEHGRSAEQIGADTARVDLIKEQCEHVYYEMEPGDALFFHANLLHSSQANDSDDPRWVLICCYNTRHNPCRDLPGHPSYTPLEQWGDERIREIGESRLAEMEAG
ncbi:phytanoyl-CoA dioxygenase family protein [Candidatus Poribacteria bacterium]|nr:phytanoyl-CoA dioxygenase family protein [Candidatus Poribacteria bacterium]